MAIHPTVCGAILAGGRSQRMFAGEPGSGSDGPRDKALLDLAGQPMLTYVIARFKPQVARLVLNANGDPARFAPFGLDIVSDVHHSVLGAAQQAGHHGPLAGIGTALHWALSISDDTEALVTVTSDVPFLPGDCVARLFEASDIGGRRPAIAVSQGQRHPTIALWPLSLLDDLTQTLADGDLSVDRFARRHRAVEVSFAMRKIGGVEVDPFFNANTPEDLANARDILARS